ncbi:hybrid signal transduction histidine kinase B [Bactrocera dorsalis]|uniref:Hybrid signal transduction histidine kinase B n=1 Tax=Bactrocera dorsalis TaxID=27457 RepID=A0A6I9V9J8_BACDO|nr:hybrid signal transduction histidine kinase B [Bactrocera dorsalis]
MLRLAIAILLTAALQPVMSQLPHSAGLASQQGLARLLFTSRLTALNPQVSVACFTDYIGHSNSISEAYGQDYKQCLLEASEERKQIDGDSAKERQEVVDAAEAVCSSLRTCNELNNTLELFNCHTKIGSANTKATYSISGNASEHATVLQERYRRVELHHQQCCQRAERRYVADTASNYNYLQACLDGQVQPTTSSTTTTTVPTTSSTTTTTTTTTEPPAPSSAPTTLPSSPSAVYDELTTTEQSQNIQQQVAQILNLLN